MASRRKKGEGETSQQPKKRRPARKAKDKQAMATAQEENVSAAIEDGHNSDADTTFIIETSPKVIETPAETDS